jgi:hypothetical protein
MPKKILKFLIPIILLVGLFLIWHNRWWFYDEYRLYGYKPPTEISQIANEDQLTSYSKTLLYVYHPSLENSVTFNNNCKVTPAAVVLGCTIIDRGIYLYNIQDPALNGVEQVTAAYEMLHVAYSRLSSSQLKTINALLVSTYNKLAPTNPQLRAEYASYLKTEGPGAIDNELHSTLGTEIPNLPQSLGNYYKKYFNNRQLIVNYANQYESVFTTRQNEVASDDSELSSLKSQINSLNTILTNEYATIESQQANMNSLKAEGNYSQYNSDIAPYNALVGQYNAQVAQDQALVNQYNSLVASRNSVAISENKLSNEINSLSATSPAN